MKKNVIYFCIFIDICLFSSCEKCIPTILCPYQNPQFYSVQGRDTASLYFPNASTPNGDGINDIYYLFGYNIASFNYKIFDASGRQIYQSSQISHLIINGVELDSNMVFLGGWDGTLNGKAASVGIYAVKATATTTFGTPVDLDGTVSIIGGQFYGSSTPPTDGNFDLEVKNAQFPDQNNNGVFDPNIPNGEYFLIDKVHNCH